MIPASLKDRAGWKAYVIYLVIGVAPGATVLAFIPGWPRWLAFTGVILVAWNVRRPIQRKVWP